MKLIAHRGNINGKNPERENTESYIVNAINASYYVEIDLWVVNNNLYLGHDDPVNKISMDFLREHASHLFIHCRDLKTLEFLSNHEDASKFRYFYHTVEPAVMTNHGEIIMHSHANMCIKNSIYMLPEILGIEDVYLKNCSGICSDVISNYLHFNW